MARAAGRELTLTLAVRTAVQFVGSPSPSATIDGIRYKVEGTADLNLDEASVIEAPIALDPSVTGLPDLGTRGLKYHTFILQGAKGLPGKGFLRVKITQLWQSPMRFRFFLPLLGIATAHGEVTFSSLLREMTDRSVVTHWPATEYLSLQSSSYNRASKTPDDPNDWFANSDCNFEIRKETNEGRIESVLMEHDGPGVLTRLWTQFFYQSLGDRKGTDIRIYIDGESTPRIQGSMIELLTGKGSVKPPFAQTTVRAGVLYLPIPFRKSCKVTRGGDSFFCLINYRAYAPGTIPRSPMISGSWISM